MMLRTGTIVFLLTSFSAFCLAEMPSTKNTNNTSAALESTVPSTPHANVISIRASCKIVPKASPATVIEVYWARGLNNERVVGDTVDHYVDLNLVVRTADFTPGECVEAVIRADDKSEVAENIEKIVLRGNVNEEGVVYFYMPLKDYTLNLLDIE